MKTNSREIVRGVLGCAVASGAASAVAPTAAYAAGADILLPKPAEFIPALIAFLIIWFVLAKLAWPKITKTLDERQEKIQGDIDEAEATRVQAQQELEAYKKKVADAQAKADDIIAEAKRSAEEQRSEVRAQAQKEAADIIANAHEAVENERRSALTELTDSVANLSVEIAGKIIDENLDTDKQRKLVEKYLAEVGNFHAD